LAAFRDRRAVVGNAPAFGAVSSHAPDRLARFKMSGPHEKPFRERCSDRDREPRDPRLREGRQDKSERVATGSLSAFVPGFGAIRPQNCTLFII